MAVVDIGIRREIPHFLLVDGSIEHKPCADIPFAVYVHRTGVTGTGQFIIDSA